MSQAWRIVPLPHVADAFTGEGARRFGGRWNSPGVPMVYCSASVSLAALETLVHLNPQIGLDYVLYEVQFDEGLSENFPRSKCAEGWNAEPPGPASMSIGDQWVREARSAVLAVPSVLTCETNYLLNPNHKDFIRIKTGKPENFTFDPRLLKK